MIEWKDHEKPKKIGARGSVIEGNENTTFESSNVETNRTPILRYGCSIFCAVICIYTRVYIQYVFVERQSETSISGWHTVYVHRFLQLPYVDFCSCSFKTPTSNGEAGRVFGQASDVADLARVVPAVLSADVIYRQDAGKRRIVAYLYVVARLDDGRVGSARRRRRRGRHRRTVTRPDLYRFVVHQPRDVERLVTLARGTH